MVLMLLKATLNCISVMSSFRWWYLLLDPHFIGIVLVVIGVIYCLWKGWGVSKKKYVFQGLGDTPFRSRKKRRRRKKNKHEERCREVFEAIFQKRFKTVRPNWLRNPATGKNLELDGYCSEIKTHLGTGLAFEYDGIQHAKYNRYFHGNNRNEFIYQVKKDEWKDLQCKKKGVLLIRIPHFVAYQDLERYISSKLRTFGLKSTTQESSEGFLAGLYD